MRSTMGKSPMLRFIIEWKKEQETDSSLLNINALNLGSGNAGSGGDASSGDALGGDAGCH